MGVGPVFSGSEKDNRDSIEMFGVYAVHIGERQNNDYCQRSQQDEEQEETKHPAKSRKKTTLEEKQTRGAGAQHLPSLACFSPFDLFRGIVQAGLLSELQLSLALPIH